MTMRVPRSTQAWAVIDVGDAAAGATPNRIVESHPRRASRTCAVKAVVRQVLPTGNSAAIVRTAQTMRRS
jgi:hypothetical protein